MSKKITLVQIRRPSQEDINNELQWLGNSFGLFGLRDKDSSCFRIFITLIKRSHRNDPISSDDIAEKLALSRGTVVHHLIRLMETGLVVKEKEGYLLRENNLERLVRDMQRDVNAIFAELEDVAKEIDKKLG